MIICFSLATEKSTMALWWRTVVLGYRRRGVAHGSVTRLSLPLVRSRVAIAEVHQWTARHWLLLVIALKPRTTTVVFWIIVAKQGHHDWIATKTATTFVSPNVYEVRALTPSSTGRTTLHTCRTTSLHCRTDSNYFGVTVRVYFFFSIFSILQSC